jgi:hypothetical protein
LRTEPEARTQASEAWAVRILGAVVIAGATALITAFALGAI